MSRYLPIVAMGILSCMLGISCSSTSEPESRSCDCPLPVGMDQLGHGPRIPVYFNTDARTAPNGNLLVYEDGSKGGLLDLRSLEDRSLAWSFGGDTAAVQASSFCWSPDSKQIAFKAVLQTPRYEQHIAIYDLSSNSIRLVTPAILQGESVGDIVAWTSVGEDRLVISGVGVTHEYFLQSKIFRVMDQHVVAGSNARDTVTRSFVNGNASYFLNGTLLPELSGMKVHRVSLSPNGSRLAVTATDSGYAFEKVYIFATTQPLKLEQVQNLQCNHCTYSFHGAHAEFTSDTTLALSIHKDGDVTSPLWEVSLTGQRLRQLTIID